MEEAAEVETESKLNKVLAVTWLITKKTLGIFWLVIKWFFKAIWWIMKNFKVQTTLKQHYLKLLIKTAMSRNFRLQ